MKYGRVVDHGFICWRNLEDGPSFGDTRGKEEDQSYGLPGSSPPGRADKGESMRFEVDFNEHEETETPIRTRLVVTSLMGELQLQMNNKVILRIRPNGQILRANNFCNGGFPMTDDDRSACSEWSIAGRVCEREL